MHLNLGSLIELEKYVDEYGLDALGDYVMFANAVQKELNLQARGAKKVG